MMVITDTTVCVCIFVVVLGYLHGDDGVRTSQGYTASVPKDLDTASVHQLFAHVGTLLQDLRGVTSHLEQMLQSQEGQTWGSTGRCFSDVSNLASRTSTIAADTEKSVSKLESKITDLQEEIDHLKVLQIKNACYPVSVTSEGGCCTFENKGPWFTVNSTEIKFEMHRGMNIIALNRKTGAVVSRGTFDTYNPSAEATVKMISFIQRDILDDSVVLVSCFDSCEKHCGHGSRCQDALHDLGATVNLNMLSHRDSYALIGYKGSYYGAGVTPSWVRDGYYHYPEGRDGKQSRPVTLHATIPVEHHCVP